MLNTTMPARGLARLAGFVLASALVTACSGRPDATPPQAADSTAGGEFTAAAQAKADSLLAQMTLAEKIGQMTQVDISYLKDPNDINTYHLGSLLSGGSSDPKSGNTLQDWTQMYESYQRVAMQGRLKIPLLYGIDAVHGNSNLLGAVIFPHNIGLGATRDSALVAKIGAITAAEVRASGIQWAFAPCVCVPRDERWGRTYEGFSEDPKLVSTLGAAAVVGLQGPHLSDDPTKVLASAKHYLADGGTGMGTGIGLNGKGLDQGNAIGSDSLLHAVFLPPYVAAIDAGVGTVMPSYSSWNGVKMSANKHLLTEVLKDSLGFKGFLISDYKALNQIDPADYKHSIEESINAGMDMVMVPDDYKTFIQDLTELVNEGKVPQSRIDDAVRRILRVKAEMGLLDPSYDPQPEPALVQAFGSREHREVARQAVRESMVLLKNDNHTLPLSKTAARIAVAGKNADDIGNQTGGWTIDWQGKSGDVTTGGTTILTAIKQAVSPSTKVTFSEDGTGAAGADVGVVVVGETPYAEMMGDRADLSLDAADQKAISNMKAAGVPVVVVLVSGRPMILGDALTKADAFVAAWLPGTEGEGVADVLFGDYKPTGKLSYTWPRSMAQIPINVGDENYDPLFPYGFGLTY
ncbi:MAG TPA: glycoside hydrolase family 3 N-terminal domain-containing protein [Longimicrobiaceae bacterium]|nr:glycoside hydrolase family 3 N-terminal domain-containing protein [Longimicrobiaceae bacterium]